MPFIDFNAPNEVSGQLPQHISSTNQVQTPATSITLFGTTITITNGGSWNSSSRGFQPSPNPYGHPEAHSQSSYAIFSSTIQNGSTGVHPFAAPMAPWNNIGEGLRNGSDVVRQLSHGTLSRLEANVWRSNNPQHPSASITMRGASAPGAQEDLLRSGVLMTRDEWETVGFHPIPLELLILAAQRRATMAELRDALEVLHRSEDMQDEDVRIISRSEFYGGLEEQVEVNEEEEEDMHEDMRFDVDNMSYEELLALEEHIGNVNTGLSQEAILGRITRHRYGSKRKGPLVDEEPCCICQDEYIRGQGLGKLDCGHEFHFNCIKQWLMQKNLCPICKMTGLNI